MKSTSQGETKAYGLKPGKGTSCVLVFATSSDEHISVYRSIEENEALIGLALLPCLIDLGSLKIFSRMRKLAQPYDPADL